MADAMTTQKVPVIHIESMQFTPGLEPTLSHYIGVGVTKGPLSTSSPHHPTRADLVAIDPAVADAFDTIEKALIVSIERELAESGIVATVQLPEPPKVEPGEVIPQVPQATQAAPAEK